MAVLSPNHHSRHLQSEEEKAEFYRTAPIETRGYWDLVNALHEPVPNVEVVEQEREKVVSELQSKVHDTRDEVTLQSFLRRTQLLIDNQFTDK